MSINMSIHRKEARDYLINTLSINDIINKKFNLCLTKKKEKTKKNSKYYNIMLYLFLEKLYNYEPGIVRLIGLFHDYNYQYLTMSIYSNERPIKLGRCMGDYYINNDDVDSCICSSCDPNGFNLLKPYRIYHRL